MVVKDERHSDRPGSDPITLHLTVWYSLTTTNGNWQAWKRSVGIALGRCSSVDVALIAYLWNGSRQGPEALRAQRNQLSLQAKVADLKRDETIRASLPQVRRGGLLQLLPRIVDAKTGYSRIE